MISNENVVKEQNLSNENVEIKEILIKDFNEILVKEFCTDWKEKRLYIELLVNSTPFSNLLDYITNLQEENEILKENAIHNDKVVDKSRWNEMIYKSRIDKAIEYMQIFSDFDSCMINGKSFQKAIDILKGLDKE